MIKNKRTKTPPPSLARRGAEWEDDLYDKLEHDFFDKCYICGKPIETDGEVEHLLPVLGNKHPERKYDWDNLFWSCRHCNGIKSNRVRIMDCCKKDPEKLIRQKGSGKDRKNFTVKVTAIDPQNDEAKATAKLISDCYTSERPARRRRNCEKKRISLKDKIDTIDGVLLEYIDMRIANKDVSAQLEILRGMVQLDQPYAGFVRTEVRDCLDCCPELEILLEIDKNSKHVVNNEEMEVPV